MTEHKPSVVSVGEVMIELTRGPDSRYGLAFGGDTFNTAVYLARAGIDVAYATALGDDPYSDALLSLASAEGVRTELIVRVPDRTAGLYLVETNAAGEHSFYYWRDHAPARELFELPQWGVIAERLLACRLIYFSGVTLSLYSNVGIGRFLALVELARKNGVKIAFDGNFRPRGWKGDVARTRTVFMEALKRVDIALPTFDDEALLWGDASPDATVERLQAFGIGEIAVKNGAKGALVLNAGARELVPVPQIVVPIDTTAAGDSFNAAYLAARLAGEAPLSAAASAHRLAGEVIRHPGAIMPRAAAVH
ncbi:MAG TPA: sugar kinase [Xanthobacteraceae bacterium]|nr:sugar kinase [Xanthobacteraceae bacterium]